MKEKVVLSQTFKIASIALFILGVIVFIYGLMKDPELAWGSFLTSGFYFVSLAIGSAFFYSIQSITQSGWSAAFKRIPEAIMSFIPYAAVLFLLMYFGFHYIYHWSHPDQVSNDVVLQHKSRYLNVPFFYIRMIACFGLWTAFIFLLKRSSAKEDLFDPADKPGILSNFQRTEQTSAIFLFIFALTFSVAAFDWIMSIEPHWYSSVFAFKNAASAFLHGVALITIIVFLLHRKGYFDFLNEYHLHDFARYIFILSIIWGYLWFAQFMIIWYGNIPEETAYYYYRWQQGWKIMFYLQIILNWGIPFTLLLPVSTSRNKTVIASVIIILLIGHYIDIFVQVMPGITGELKFGWIEAGIFLGFAGLFAFAVGTALSRVNLIPANHPYLQESIEHKFE